jgi:hypothetical protein
LSVLPGRFDGVERDAADDREDCVAEL